MNAKDEIQCQNMFYEKAALLVNGKTKHLREMLMANDRMHAYYELRAQCIAAAPAKLRDALTDATRKAIDAAPRELRDALSKAYREATTPTPQEAL